MSTTSIRVGDVGTRVILTIKDENGNIVDLGPATSLKITIRKPTGTLIEDDTPSLLTDGSDGKLYYDFVDGDVDEVGRWRVQAWAELPSGEWNSTIEDFTVGANL